MRNCETFLKIAAIGLIVWIPADLRAQPPGKTGGSGMLFYEPGSRNPAADNWCLKKNGLWYVYTLNGPGQDSIGVAVSRDLMTYEGRGVAIPSVRGAWENSLSRRDTGVVGLFLENATGKSLLRGIYGRHLEHTETRDRVRPRRLIAGE